jgi:hypothetical protein
MKYIASLAAIVLAACGDANAPAPSDASAREPDPLPSEPGASTPVVEAPAPAQPPSVFPASDVQAAWKAELQAACASDAPTIEVASFDMTGDGKPERICWRVIKASPAGEYLDIAVLHEGVRRQSAYMLLPADGSVQNGVCPSENYTVSPTEWTSAEGREDYGIPVDWPELGLTIGNECDSVHLFWPNNADSGAGSEVPFYFARL